MTETTACPNCGAKRKSTVGGCWQCGVHSEHWPQTTVDYDDKLVVATALVLREIDLATKKGGKVMTYEEAAWLLLGIMRAVVKEELRRE